MVQLIAKYGRKILLLSCMVMAVQVVFASGDTIKLDVCDFLTTDQTLAQDQREQMCYDCAIFQKAPEYYCDCHFGPRFYYGIDSIIADPTWFNLNIGTVRQKGFQLYWFSEDSIMAELYAQCVQTKSMQEQIIPGDRGYGLTPDRVNDMMGSLGSGSQMNNKNIHLRVYPVGGKSGRVMGFPAEEGFVSTCENPFKLFYGMNLFMPASLEETVYELLPQDIPASNPITQLNHTAVKYSTELFVRKQGGTERSRAKFFITYGACDGPIVYSTTIKDTVDLHFPPREVLKQAKKDSVSLFFHFDADDKFGFIVSKNTKWNPAISIDTTICEGMGIELADTILYGATTYADTVRVKNNTALQRVIYNISVYPTIPVDTVVELYNSQLPYRFLGFYQVKNFGKYTVTKYSEEACARNYHLTVKRLYHEKYKSIDTTLCQGATFTLNKKEYITSQTIKDTTWLDKGDTRLVTTYNLYFSAPELEYDTLHILPFIFPYKYHGEVIDHFGEYRIYMKGVDGECDREVLLNVENSVGTLTKAYNTIDTTICKGMYIQLSDTALKQPTTYIDSIYLEGDTLLITTYNVMVTLPEEELDTLITETFPAHYLDTIVSGYGTYTIYFEEKQKCDRLIKLTVRPFNVKYLFERVDTTICQGKVFQIGYQSLTTTGLAYDTVPLTEYSAKIVEYYVRFTPPEATHDTISIAAEEMPYDYYGYSVRRYGDHNVTIHEEGECDKKVQLYVRKATGIGYILSQQLQVKPTIVEVREDIIVEIPAEGLLQVIDVLGRVVLSEQIDAIGEKRLTIGTAGNYLLRLTTKKGVHTRRVIVR